MGQFGSETIITPNVSLLILDCFETLVELREGRHESRKGIIAFLRHFGPRMGLKLVVHSDGSPDQVRQALNEAGLSSYFHAVYAGADAVEDLGDGRVRKRLDLTVQRHRVKPEDAVFIGDSPLDAEAAQHHGLRFVRVPRSEDRDFTFTRLIGGPSRYSSAEFSSTFLKRYLGENYQDNDLRD